MKKLVLVSLVCLFLVSGFSGVAFGQDPVVLRLAEIHEASYPTTVGAFELARLVELRTEGRVRIEVYHSMVLGDEAAVIKKIQDGEIDLTRINIGPVTKYVPALNAFLMPYIFRDTDHMLKVVNGPVGNDVLAACEKSDFIGFGWFDGGTRNFYTNKPVKAPGDLKDMRIRTLQNDLMVAMINSLGAKAIPMPHGDTYAALKAGVLDGAENNYPTYDETNHYQLAKYFIEDEHTRNPDLIVGSKKSIEAKCSKEDIEIIKQAVREAQALQFELWAQTVKTAKDKVIAAGCEITMLTPAQKQLFADAVQPIYDAQPQDIQDLIKRIRAVR
ncbi:MAG: TRAP transporter substrate-binding protein [Negativicutes bacterium]|nr:TRAP transporter substrate-binding protein [Negativicutes bacterium]